LTARRAFSEVTAHGIIDDDASARGRLKEPDGTAKRAAALVARIVSVS